MDALLPHPAPVRLLDRVIAASGPSLWTSYTPSATHWYADDQGDLPAAVGIEALAQASAALFTVLAKASDSEAPPRPGMLIASRRYRSAVSEFPQNVALLIAVSAETPLDGVLSERGVLVRFTGRIANLPGQLAESDHSVPSSDPTVVDACARATGKPLAEAAFSVYLPPLGAALY